MKQKNKSNTIGKIYFFYLFFMLFLQIIGYSSKGAAYDTLWKAAVIAVTMFFVLLKSQLRIQKFIIMPVMIYLVGQVIAQMFCPSTIVQVSSVTRMINTAIIIAMLFLFFSFPYTWKGNGIDSFKWFLISFIILMIYAVIFNIIKNPTAVFGVLRNNSVYSNMMSSFFDNKQTFGMFLLLAVISSAFLMTITGKKRYAFVMIGFLLNLFICLSRTALLAGLVFLIMSAVLMIGKNTGYAKFILTTAVAIIIVVLSMTTLRTFIINVVLDTDKTVDARQDIWASAFSTLKGIQWFVGYGDGTATPVLRSVAQAAYTHNGIVQVLITGGVLKLVLYVLALAKCLKSIIAIKVHDSRLAAMFLSALVSIFVYSMGEAIVLFDTSAPCVAATIICAGFPCIIEAYYKNKTNYGIYQDDL